MGGAVFLTDDPDKERREGVEGVGALGIATVDEVGTITFKPAADAIAQAATASRIDFASLVNESRAGPLPPDPAVQALKDLDLLN